MQWKQCCDKQKGPLMALVTVTGNVTDITGKADPDQLSFYTPEIRNGVLSTRVQRINPNPTTGAFSVQLQEGPAKVRVRGKPYDFTAAAGDLWAMIQVGLSIPPETPAEKLAEVVNAWTQSVADGKYATLASVAAKYTKPGAGVPKTDLASGVQSSLDKADSALNQSQVDARVTAVGANAYAPLAQAVPTGGAAAQVLTKTANGFTWADATVAAYDGGVDY